MKKHSPLVALFICTVLLIASRPAMINGQAETPTPTPGATFQAADSRSFTDVFFPEGVRFEWSITGVAADQIDRVTLTLRPAQGDPITIDPAEIELVFTDPSAVYVSIWPFPVEAPPALFSTLEYTWQAFAGETLIAGYSSAFLVEDTRTAWQVADTGSIRLVAPVEADPDALAAALRPVYTLLAQQTGNTPRFNWLLYLDPLVPTCTTREGSARPVTTTARNDGVLECREAEAHTILRDYTVMQVTASNAFSTLHRMMVLEFYAPIWRDNPPPAWFIEALIAFYDPTPKDALYTTGIEAARTDQALTLAQLGQTPTPATADLWRAQAYGLLLYTADRIGFDGVFGLAASTAETDDFATRYATATGFSLAAILPGWERWIVSPTARRAYALTPYQAATPTPSITPTVTPSRTPSLTASATLIPSATPTGVLSPTPFITATLTPSLTPAPASATPRPVGSLATPTPSRPPGPPSPIQNAGMVQSSVLAILGGILIVLIMLFLWSGRRRR